MANQESHYQRVKNAFTPYLLVREDYDRKDKIAQAEIDLNEKLNQLGYIDGQDITGQFIRITTMPQSLDPEERFRPLSDRLNIDFTRLLSEFFNSPEYRQARRARRERRAVEAAAADAELARVRCEHHGRVCLDAAAVRCDGCVEAQARLVNAYQRHAAAQAARNASAAARVESEAASQAAATAREPGPRPAAALIPAPAAAAAAAATAAPPQRARKNRKTRVRSRKMRKTRKNSSR